MHKRNDILAFCLTAFIGPQTVAKAGDTVSKPEAQQHVLELSESFNHFIKAVMARFGKVPLAYKAITPPLTELTKVLTGEEVDLAAYQARAEALTNAIIDGDEALNEILGAETGEEADGDHSIENIVGHWDNVKYHANKLEWVGNLSEGQNSIRVGPIQAEDQKRALSSTEVLQQSIETFRAAVEGAPEDMMYRNLYLTQFKGMEKPLETIRSALSSNPPWWTPDSFRALSEIIRIHEVTRNQQGRLTAELRRPDFAYSSALNELVRSISPIEGGARNAKNAVQIVYEAQPLE